VALFVSPGLIITPTETYPQTYPLVGWHNVVAFGNITADSSPSATPVTNLANPNTDQAWASASTAEQLVTISSLNDEIDYLAVARHNFGSAGIEISVETLSGEPAAVWEEVIAATLVADDSPLMLQWEAATVIGVRLRLVPGATAPSAAVLYVGKSLRMMRGVQPGFTPIRDGMDVTIRNGRSEAGEFLGAIITGEQLSTVADFRFLDADWYLAEMRDFVASANRGAPFFWAWNPLDYPDEVGFCWLSGVARPVKSQLSGEIDISLSMGGLAL